MGPKVIRLISERPWWSPNFLAGRPDPEWVPDQDAEAHRPQARGTSRR